MKIQYLDSVFFQENPVLTGLEHFITTNIKQSSKTQQTHMDVIQSD